MRFVATHFDAADTNRDGRLDAAELEAGRATARREARAKRFGEFDANGDGQISRDEIHSFSMQP